jgi:ribosomal silencing factor RsfS
VAPREAATHYATCRQNASKGLFFDEKTRMTPLQIEAVRHMHQRSEKEHNSVKSALQQRVKKLGFSIEDLNNLQFYIENYAPIIIHVHVSKHMEFFVKDTHYRSQF